MSGPVLTAVPGLKLMLLLTGSKLNLGDEGKVAASDSASDILP